MELTWTAEGGSDETQVSEANSGSTSGTAWNTVAVGTDATLVYDTAQSAHGTLSVRHATGATSTTANMLWTSTAIGSHARLWGRFYVRFSNVSTSRSIARIRSGITQIARVQINTSGEIELRNSANTPAATSTTVLSVNTWYRIEFDVRPGAAVSNELRLFVGDSTTLLESVAASSNYSAATTVTEAGFGNFANGANVPACWYDSIQVNDSAFPGPASSTVTGTATANLGALTVTATGTRTVSGAATASLGALTATASGTRTVNGTATAALGALTVAASGTVSTPIANLIDDFDDNSIDAGLWPGNYGGVAETGGRARVDCDTAQWSAYKSAAAYTLSGSSVSCRIWPPTAGGATDTAYASLLVTTTTPGTDAGVLIDVVSSGSGAYMGLLNRVGFGDGSAVYLPYDPVEHAWIRLSESAGTITWETSPDGSTWTTRRTDTAPGWVSDTDLALVLESHRGTGTDDYAEYDSLNAAPTGATVSGTATVALGFAVTATGTRTVSGQAAAGLGGLTATAVGTRTVGGSAAASLGGLTATASGARTVQGAATVPLGGIAATATGIRTVSGTAAAPLGGITVTAAGGRTVHGVATAPLGALAVTAAGTRIVTGTATASLAGLAVTATGTRIVAGHAAVPLGGLTATASGIRTVTGAATAALGPATVTATGARTVHGTVTVPLGGLTATAVQQVIVRPGVHTAGTTRPGHTPGSSRPDHTSRASRPVLAATTSRG